MFRNKRFIILVALAALAVLAILPDATARAGNGTDKFGPFTLTSPDGGSCGAPWADDTVDRYWSVHDNGDGTFLVKRRDKNGTFVTYGGDSPGKCSDSAHHGTSVSAGIQGKMRGFFMFDVTSSSYNPSACTTSSDCATTSGFLAAVFPGYTDYCSTTCIWNFEYSSKDKSLQYRHWQDKSDNTGNDKFEGDIANQ